MKERIKSALRWSEKYTKTDMTYLAGGGFWTTLNYSIQVGLGIVITVALANFLPKDVLGTYQFVLSVAAVLSVLTLSGLSKVITRAVAQGNNGILRSGVRTKLKWSIGIVLSSGAVAIYYLLNSNTELAVSFLIVGAFAPFIESFRLSESYLIGKKAFKDTAILGFWRKPFPLIAIISTLYFTDNLVTLVFVYFASNALSFLAVYYAVLRKYQPPITSDEDSITYSKHLSVLKIAAQIAANLDKILIWHFLGAGAVASFTIAQLATRYSGNLLNIMNSLVLPRVSKRDLPTLQKTLPRKVWLLTLMMSLGALIYILVIPFVFPLLFPTYPESILISQVLAISLLLIPRSVFGQVFTAHKQLKAQYVLGIVNPVIKIVTLVMLVPPYGIWGAVSALLITDFICYLLVYWLFKNAEITE